MTSTPETASPSALPVTAANPLAHRRVWRVWLPLGVAGLALLVSVLLWQKLSRIQEQLARQSSDAGQQSLEAKAWAKQAKKPFKTVQPGWLWLKPVWAKWPCSAANWKS